MSADSRELAERIAALFGKTFIGDGGIEDKSLSDVCGTIERMVDEHERTRSARLLAECEACRAYDDAGGLERLLEARRLRAANEEAEGG